MLHVFYMDVWIFTNLMMHSFQDTHPQTNHLKISNFWPPPPSYCINLTLYIFRNWVELVARTALICFSLKKIKYLVLDEADRLLEGGFDGQLSVIFDNLSKRKQTLLFSATFSSNVEEFIEKTAMSQAPFVWREKEIDEDRKRVLEEAFGTDSIALGADQSDYGAEEADDEFGV